MVGVTAHARRTTSQKDLHTLLALCLVPGAWKPPARKGPTPRFWNFSPEYSLPWLPGEFILTWLKGRGWKLTTPRYKRLNPNVFGEDRYSPLAWCLSSPCCPLSDHLKCVFYLLGPRKHTWVHQPSFRHHPLHDSAPEWRSQNLPLLP